MSGYPSVKLLNESREKLDGSQLNKGNGLVDKYLGRNINEGK